MPEDKTNLPILDDIIKPGDSDKAVHQPSSKVQTSLWSSDKSGEPPSGTGLDATDSQTAPVDQDFTAELYTQELSDNDALDQVYMPLTPEIDEEPPILEPLHTRGPFDTANAPASPIDLPDIDTLTGEILHKMMPEIEQVLREKIRQTLAEYLPDDRESD